MKKSLLSIAIIAAMPFAAHATDPVVAVGPAHASSNPVVATANAPYVTVTPSTADESHIATTAYVKGAYNDAIAAVNNVNRDIVGIYDYMNNDLEDKIEEKQGKLMNMESTPQPISNNVVSSSQLQGWGQALPYYEDAAMWNEALDDVSETLGTDIDNTIATTGAVVTLIKDATGVVREEIYNAIVDTRVTIYTTWDDDDTTMVELSSI